MSDLGPYPVRRSIRISRKKSQIPGGHVGPIDPGICTNETVTGFGNGEIPAPPKNRYRLIGDDSPALVFIVVIANHRVFGLGNNLVGNNEHVTVLQDEPDRLESG
jgi:hypothetical protein